MQGSNPPVIGLDFHRVDVAGLALPAGTATQFIASNFTPFNPNAPFIVDGLAVFYISFGAAIPTALTAIFSVGTNNDQHSPDPSVIIANTTLMWTMPFIIPVTAGGLVTGTLAGTLNPTGNACTLLGTTATHTGSEVGYKIWRHQ